MTDQKRDPHSDNDLLDDDLPAPSQGGASGGGMQREIAGLDDEKVATGADPQPTSVHKSQKPNEGDESNLPNRAQSREGQDKAPPKRTS